MTRPRTEGPCGICKGPHGFSICPDPIIAPRVPRKPDEDDRAYHKRLRYNAYMKLWVAEKFKEPGYRDERNAAIKKRRSASPHSADRVRNRRAHDRATEWLNEIKSKQCMDCSGSFPTCCMQFDHRPGEEKLFEVGHVRRLSKEKLLAEIAKCDLICANCHSIRTVARLQPGRLTRDAAYQRTAPSPRASVAEHAAHKAALEHV